MLKQYSILAAFLIGVMHVFEPCEDKAIVSVYVAWAGDNFKETLKLILLYGFGMLLINVLVGFIFAFLGVNYLQSFQEYLGIGVSIFTIIFGLLIIYHSHIFGNHCLLEHNHQKVDFKSKKSILLFGLLRGLPLCPVEIAIMLWAASSGSILYGTSLVAFFSLGTALSLIPFGMGAKGFFKFINGKASDKTKKTVQLFVGIGIVITGIITLFFSH